MRYLAIDYGAKRTGLAICDAEGIVCSPLTVLQGKENLCARIVALAAEEGVEAFVVGLPLNMDDSEGFQAKQVRTFAKALAGLSDLPIHFQDERLSSYSAQEKWAERAVGKKGRAKHLDALAAAEILTAFLDRRQLETGSDTSEPEWDESME